MKTVGNKLENDELTQLRERLSTLEQQGLDEYITLLEIMSNATFFGDIKRASCEHAKNGQCSYFVLKNEAAKEKLPIATRCRVKDCPTDASHYHIEVSNVSCALCPKWHNKPTQ